jgi:hypothetical protein
VCAEWRRAALDEPTLWQHIDLHFDKSDVINEQAWLVRLAMGQAAVDRSAGLRESFHGVAEPDLLAYLADRYDLQFRSDQIRLFIDRLIPRHTTSFASWCQ